MKRPIPQALKDEAVALYLESDLSAREVAERYNVTERTLLRWVRIHRAQERVMA